MIFNSLTFLLGFLPIFIFDYYLAPAKYRNAVLLAGSLIFYAWGEPVYVFLLILSAAVHYIAGRTLDIDRKKKRKTEAKTPLKKRILYWFVIALDVLTLAFFKWAAPGGNMPLGISFYMFQAMSYLTDVYRGDIRAERSVLRLGTYISMFPQILSGPIVAYAEVEASLRQRVCRFKQIDRGLKQLVAGLCLKVLLADTLSLLWNGIRTVGAVSISAPLAWLGVFSYSMQIYFDFWGYSLMAVGLGRMLGFELPCNFDSPYAARSVREFYRRWHMTLGRWFRNYVYIPLGGNRKGSLRTVFNLFVVWVLTALWHGGDLNFLIWGFSLWFLITAERLLDKCGALKKLKLLPHLYLLFVIPLTWLCFAVTDIGELGVYFGRMFGAVAGVNVKAGDFVEALKDYGAYLLAGVFCCTPFAARLFEKWKDRLVGMIVLAVLFWVCVWRISAMGNNPFMYLRF